MKWEKSYQGEAVNTAAPIPRVFDVRQWQDRKAAMNLLATPGTYAAFQLVMWPLVVVWLYAGGAKSLRKSS